MGTTQEAARESTNTTRHTPKSSDFFLLAMFTAGNMTYMRKRKKERQAAKRAMARENAILDAMEKEREEQELAEAMEKENEPVEFYDVCNNGGKPKRRTFTTD